MSNLSESVQDEVALEILKAHEQLTWFEDALNGIGVDTSNSQLQFINLPRVIGLLYGITDNDDT